MSCYFCGRKLGAIKVAVGWAKEVHPDCYEPFKAFLEQIRKVYAELGR